MMRRHKSLTTPNKNTNHKQTRRHSSQVIISSNYELRDAILTKPPPPVDSNSSGSDNDNNVDDIKKARRERRRRSHSRRRRKSFESSVNNKKKLQSNHDDINSTNCNNDSSIDILNGNHDQVLKDSLLLAKQHLHHQPSTSTSLRRSLSHNEIYNCSTISLLDDIDIIPTKESNEHTNQMKSNLLACSITTDSSASFVGTENIKMLHISDDEEHSIVSSVDDSVGNTTTQQKQQSQGINKEKNNNNSSRTLNTSATTTSNPQPSSPSPPNQPNKSQPLSQSIIMEEHIALKLNVAQLHTELQTSQIQLNKYTLGLQQATSGLKSAQLAMGKLQSKNIKLVERNGELESENYYLLILLKNLIDEGDNGVGGIGKKGSSLEEMLAPLKTKGVASSSSERGLTSLKDNKKGKKVAGEDNQRGGWRKASTWWKDRSNRSSDIEKDDDDDEVLVVQGLPLIDNSDRGGVNGGEGGSSAQSNKSSYKPGASVRSLKSSNKSSSGASGWWGGNNNRHRRSKSGGEVSDGCGSSWHTSATSGNNNKGVREEGETELLDGVPNTLIDKIRNLSVTLSRGSNMAVDSSKQKRGKCQEVGQGEVDDHPPVPDYVQWNDDRKIDYCSDVSFDGIVVCCCLYASD